MKWFDNKSVQAAFIRSPGLKAIALTLVMVLLLAAAGGVGVSSIMPEEEEQTVTLANYEHQGEFDYLVYIEPGYLFSNPLTRLSEVEEEEEKLYFTDIIDDIEVSFTYGFAPDYPAIDVSSDVDIVAIIYGPSGWQKEVPIKSATDEDEYFIIRFPLELDEYDDLINDVEKELEIREEQPEYEYTYEYDEEEEEWVYTKTRAEISPNSYDLVIEARVTVQAYTGTEWIEDTFDQSMELNIDEGTIQWDDELNLVQRSFQCGFSYKQMGNFDYTISLDREKTALYGGKVITLSPEPYEAPLVISRSPGEVYFNDTIDIMKTSFDYSFVCDQPVTKVTGEVTVTAVLEYIPDNLDEQYTEVWEKTFMLVPTTEHSGDFSVEFPVDITYFNSYAEAIGEETGVGARSCDLNIEAVVHTTADIGFSYIDETFTHTLAGSLNSSTLTWDEELEKSEPKTIETTIIVANPQVPVYQRWSVILLVVILLGSSFIVWNANRAGVVMSGLEKEAFKARKKYKDIIADAEELPAIRPEDTVITCVSLDELVKVAETLFKPVLHQAAADKHTYRIIDGSTQYEYTGELDITEDWEEYRDRVRSLIAEELRKATDKDS